MKMCLYAVSAIGSVLILPAILSARHARPEAATSSTLLHEVGGQRPEREAPPLALPRCLVDFA
jgi:hypothetical protein